MSPMRLLAVGFIFVCTAVGMVHPGRVRGEPYRRVGRRAGQEVAQLWGGRHQQLAPAGRGREAAHGHGAVQEKDNKGRVTTRKVTEDGHRLRPAAARRQPRSASRSDLEPARKGLLWYDTYGVRFHGRTASATRTTVQRTLVVGSGSLPVRRTRSTTASCSAWTARRRPPAPTLAGRSRLLTLPAGAARPCWRSRYRSRGLGALDVRVRAHRRRPGARLHARPDHRLPRHRLPRGHAVADHADADAGGGLDARAGASTAWSPARRSAWTRPTA